MTNKPIILTIDELNTYEKKWRWIFSAYGLVLAAALIYLVTFHYSPWNATRICYIVGSIAAIGCLHAAKNFMTLRELMQLFIQKLF